MQIACSTSGGSVYEVHVNKYCNSTPHCFEKIQAAIDAAPENSAQPYRIYIANGDYHEKITLNKNNLQLMGQSIAKTRLVFGDYAGIELSPGKILTTPASASFTIRAVDIQIKNITIENNFDFLKNDALANNDPKKVIGSQAVALFIDAPSDRVLLRNVTLLGYQDTLFVNSGRSWLDRVLVAGNVDYIFGNGNALFTRSEIKTRARGKPATPHGFITAPSTLINSTFGFTFLQCRLTRDVSVSNNSVALGRPWHPNTQFSDGRYADPSALGKSVFINTWMDAHIAKDGWYAMSGTEKTGGRKMFLPEHARFFEYQTQGAGAAISEKRRQLDSEDIKKYTRKKILGDWRPN
jgi:pectinesterase